MDDDENGVEVTLVHPWELSDEDWLQIAIRARQFAFDGETDIIKACVLGYVDWLDIEELKKGRKH